MTLDELNQAFLRRLENWGHCHRQDFARPLTSPTYEVCRRLALAKGMNLHEGFRESEPRYEANEDDARIIEWCWCQCQYRMPAKLHGLLRIHFVMQHDKRIVCRALGFRLREYDSWLADAAAKFEPLVAMLEGVQMSETVR